MACWLPFFILYLATPFVPVEPPDILMPALTWLGSDHSALSNYILYLSNYTFCLSNYNLHGTIVIQFFNVNYTYS